MSIESLTAKRDEHVTFSDLAGVGGDRADLCRASWSGADDSSVGFQCGGNPIEGPEPRTHA
jgi:hypothetical protein